MRFSQADISQDTLVQNSENMFVVIVSNWFDMKTYSNELTSHYQRQQQQILHNNYLFAASNKQIFHLRQFLTVYVAMRKIV